MCSPTLLDPLTLAAIHSGSQPHSALSSYAEHQRTEAWERKFSNWRSPPSDSEAEKIERTERMIREAIKAGGEYLNALDLEIIVQGSYSNNTNVKGESDVDICVMMRDTFHYYMPTYSSGYHLNNYTPPPPIFKPETFKWALHEALKAKFGKTAVTWDSKCLKIRSSSARVDADVVAAIPHHHYLPQNGQAVTPSTSFIKGTAIYPDSGDVIINWPVQHGENGRAKNNRTGGRYKAVVRILKSLNLDMAGQSYKPIASFLIESLIYNCPDNCFGHDTLGEDVQKVLTQISFLNTVLGNSGSWVEVNGIKPLFATTQKWVLADALNFSSRVKLRLAGNP